MYLTPQAIRAMEETYGAPRVLTLAWTFRDREFALLAASQHHNRAHDITLFIRYEGCYVVIRKPTYPPGVFRTPSGGVRPGETIEAGALREAYEETGLRAVLERYILRVRCTFHNGERVIPWTTHVFTAVAIDGRLGPIDTREIAEVRLATLDEMETTLQAALEAADSDGLKFRAFLSAEAVTEIRALAARDPAP